MMAASDGHGYQHMLAFASKEHQRRHQSLQRRLVGHGGNVFLPALATQQQPRQAMQLAHLELIEQCIARANTREEALAKCGSERERQRLTRHF